VNPERLHSLMSLLEDDDQHTAGLAMAELLAAPEDLDRILPEMQESASSVLRRRAHQLQNILNVRRRRGRAGETFARRQPSLIEGLLELHMLWYDEDLEDEIMNLWHKLLEQVDQAKPETPEAMARFLRRLGLTIGEPEECNPDHHCFGTVVEDLVGADYMVCAVARLLAAEAGWNGEVVATPAWGFCLIDRREGVLLVPGRNWRVKPRESAQGIEPWSDEMVLRLAAAMLFLESVRSDSPRYAFTLGSALARSCPGHDFAQLPYPLGEHR
jgi:hypothetical protein